MSNRFPRCPDCGGPLKQLGLTMPLTCGWCETEWDVEELETEQEGEDESQKGLVKNDRANRGGKKHEKR